MRNTARRVSPEDACETEVLGRGRVEMKHARRFEESRSREKRWMCTNAFQVSMTARDAARVTRRDAGGDTTTRNTEASRVRVMRARGSMRLSVGLSQSAQQLLDFYARRTTRPSHEWLKKSRSLGARLSSSPPSVVPANSSRDVQHVSRLLSKFPFMCITRITLCAGRGRGDLTKSNQTCRHFCLFKTSNALGNPSAF